MTGPDPRLLTAYTAADYAVQAPRPFTLHVAEASAALSALQRQFRVASSVVVTACNPRGERRDAQPNALAHQHLLRTVTGQGWMYVPAINRDPRGEWPEEPALLILGPDETQSRELGRSFRQAAVLFSAADGVPRLLWC